MFENRYMTASEISAFSIERIDERYVVGGTRSRSWTRDDENNVYLRWVAKGREEGNDRSTWNLFIEGHLFEVGVQTLRVDRPAPGEIRVAKRIIRIRRIDASDISDEKLLSKLIESLEAYREGGVFSTSEKFTLELEIAAGVLAPAHTTHSSCG